MEALQILALICILTNHMASSEAKEFCDTSIGYTKQHNITSLELELKSDLSGLVVTPWDDQYGQFRAIHNPACCQRPLLIVRPANSQVWNYIIASLVHFHIKIKMVVRMDLFI